MPPNQKEVCIGIYQITTWNFCTQNIHFEFPDQSFQILFNDEHVVDINMEFQDVGEKG